MDSDSLAGRTRVDVQPRSTTEPLVFHDRLTEADMVDIWRCCDRITIRRSIRWVAIGFSTFLTAVIVLAIALRSSTTHVSPGAYFVTGCFLVAWVHFVFVRPSERVWLARRHYRRHADEFYETQVTLTPDSVKTENEAHRSEYRWDLVKLVVDAPTGIMFCGADRRMLFWLPERLLQADMRARVLALVKSKEVPVQRPR